MKASLSYRTLALRGVRFYWRTQLSVFLGTALAAAVLVGGLLVGDSVSYSLREFALMRLGQTHAAMHAHGRFFDAALAQRMAEHGNAPIVAALVLHGVVIMDTDDGEPAQVNHVQIIGVDDRFWALAEGAAYPLDAGSVGINHKLSAQLGAAEGAEISVRVGKPGLMPRDAPLSSRSEKLTQRGRFTVRHVVPDDRLGRFSLTANQVAPYNVFVDIEWLQEAIGLPRRANLLLVGRPVGGALSSDQLSAALRDAWKLEDVGIALRAKGDVVQLESDRIFLDPATARAAQSLTAAGRSEAVGALTYLVNGIALGARSTPYSFAVATQPTEDTSLGLVPLGMRDDQIMINRWLADHLVAKAGDVVTVSYYEFVPGGEFVERERKFTVFRVVSMEELQGERLLAPEFPGLTDVDRCREWEVGMPMREEALNDEANEAYWETYRDTPKVIVTLDAGRDMWANRFGDTSAVRFRVGAGGIESLQKALNSAIDPAALGLFFVPVREEALRAVSDAMSFGELFVSMSFFLIIAALSLTGMLFVFGVQQRAAEMGLLLGVGHPPRKVRRLFLWEGVFIALAGSALGGVLGTGYTRALIWGLARYWQGAVAGSAIRYHAEASTMIEGIIATTVCAVFAMAIAMWHQTRRPARELLAGDMTQGSLPALGSGPRLSDLVTSIVLALAAAAVAGFAQAGGEEHKVYAFFGAGALLLASGLVFSRWMLRKLESGGVERLSISRLGMRNASRRCGRSLTAVALLACGCFLVFAVSVMQQDLSATAHERWSGTGGFSLFGEATLPVLDALETEKGRAAFGLDREEALAGAGVLSLKVRDGDDASCFNLNRAQSPRLLGLDPAAMMDRGAFMSGAEKGGAPWSLLDRDYPEGVIPGLVGDANTAMWNLGKKVGPRKGDEIVYKDERGDLFRVKLVGVLPMPLSILQGTILISRADFSERYPSEAGYRMFLIDLPEGTDPVAAQRVLARRLDRVGLDVTSTLSRLEDFHAVEATYLSMFLVLGGLGVILGTFGLGVIVLRNMLERRPELAMLRCVGFSRGRIVRLALAEHWLLLVLGLVCGLISAAVAIYPSLAAPGMHVPVGTISLILAAIIVAGLVSTTLAVHLSLRGPLLAALRRE
ncbi:MAG: FtsX-like permease family protein [Verrucomicrobia bacterium]|nr:FtsX-like permease family protein [Verrucomicrobiota bacterium]